MPRKPKLTKQNGKLKRKKPFVKGYGGMVGRGVGYLSKQMTTKGSTANWMLKKVRQLANAVNVEYKYIDVASTANAMSYTSTYGILNTIPQGSAESQRIGDSLKLQNLTLRFNIQRTSADSFARILIVWDKQNAAASASDILTGLGTVNSTNGPKNYDKRFVTSILYDKTFNVNSNHPQQMEDIVVTVDQHTQYAAGTTTINTGALKILYLSNLSAGANNPNLNYYARLTYTDD